MIPDHDRGPMVERASVVRADPEAAKSECGTGFHQIGEDHVHRVGLVYDAMPGEQLPCADGCVRVGRPRGATAIESSGRSIATSMSGD